jgi:hypothetical protein
MGLIFEHIIDPNGYKWVVFHDNKNDLKFRLPTGGYKVLGKWEEENYFLMKRAIAFAFKDQQLFEYFDKHIPAIDGNRVAYMSVVIGYLSSYLSTDALGYEYWKNEGFNLLTEEISTEMIFKTNNYGNNNRCS